MKSADELGSKFTREALAYHEAGHAVASHAALLPVREVSIDAEESRGSLGHVAHEDFYGGASPDFDRSSDTIKKTEAHIMSSFAGDLAVAIWNLRVHAKLQAKRGAGTEQDNQNAMALLLNLSGSEYEAQAHLRLLRIRTINLLTTSVWWKAVDAVAMDLLRNGTIDGERLGEIISTTQSNASWCDKLEKRLGSTRVRLSKLEF